MPSNAAMRNSLTFDAVVDRVLAGLCEVETAEGVSPWPTGVRVGDAVISVLMHRDVPGAICLFGEIDGATVLTGAFSDRLKDYIAQHRASMFRFDSCRSPEASIRFLFKCVAEIGQTHKEDDNFRFVLGIEGAELLFELKRVSGASEVLQ